jgi:hypothetical protein
MKNILRAAMIVAAVACAPSAFAQQSIGSKLEQLGEMRYVRVAGLKQVVRDGRMNLQIEFQNDDNETRAFAWRIRWLDDAGFQVWEDEAWKQELIHGKQRRLLQTVSPSMKATDFRIELHSPENNAVGTPQNQPLGG